MVVNYGASSEARIECHWTRIASPQEKKKKSCMLADSPPGSNLSIKWSTDTLETLDNALVTPYLVAVFFFPLFKRPWNLFLRKMLNLACKLCVGKVHTCPTRHSAKVLAWARFSAGLCFHADFGSSTWGCCPEYLLPFLELVSHRLSWFFVLSFSSGTFSFSKNNFPPSTTLLQKAVKKCSWSSLPPCRQDPSSTL